MLATDAPDVKLSRRIIRLEQLINGKWQHASYQWTDASGRVIWLVPNGRYTIRAIFRNSSELRGANSRALDGQRLLAKRGGPVRSPAVHERVLTTRELNRALLARQLLLERVRVPLPRVLERIGGIQNQYAPNGYIRLWSSVEGFERDDLTRALERRSVIQGSLMRETIHLVSRRDYPLFAAGIRRSNQEWRLRVDKRADDREVAAAARKLARHLRGRTISRKELGDFARGTTGGVGHWVDLVRVPPCGTWEQRGAHTFGLASEWVGPLEITEDEGIEHLARRYLGAFGPAPAKDVANWSKISPKRLVPVLERMRLRRFRDESGTELLDLQRAPLPDPETPAPVRFLPTWDATLLVHARRTLILPEAYRERIFHVKAPHSFPTFLVDGQVAGTWRYEDGRVRIQPFARLPRGVRAELEDEAQRLAAFHE